ncbi:hypothetical protein PHK61_25395 [Actinomycetospora lutea]|uniref:hypothetical protein n=1 Tax=Actinomycetospora lutea TaxID=663604 RepID=UPI002365BCF2|nr:hypothetical protein [Actinomycetospora lutea]MDD7941758.1 hypothetical protein [Actinomycetospora lutea]
MTATPDATPEPMAALPLLAEAGVSVYWVPLEGRTAWVADAATRQVWVSRTVPREALLGCLIEALRVLDEETSAPGLRLVHSADRVAEGSGRPSPILAVVDEG